MSENKFTPGPWSINGRHQYEGELTGGADLIENPDVGSVCVMIDTDDPEVCEANTRLVCASPDLLTSLELAEGFISGFEDDETQTNVPWMLATIRAAIGKARGDV